jgi:hypothetical protein
MQSSMLTDNENTTETPNTHIDDADSRFEGGTIRNDAPKSCHDCLNIGHALQAPIKANRPEWPIKGEAKGQGNTMTK